MNRKRIFTLLVTIFTLLLGCTVYADNISDVNTSHADNVANHSSEGETIIGAESMIGSQVDDKQVDNYVDRKGSSVVSVVRKGALYLTMIFFVIAAIYTIAGVVGSKASLGKGILAMIIVAVVFTCIYFAPQLLFTVKNWLAA